MSKTPTPAIQAATPKTTPISNRAGFLPQAPWRGLSVLLAVATFLSFAAPTLAGSSPTPTLARDLSGLHMPAISVGTSRWSPDGQFLVYFVDVDFDGQLELHSVSSSGPAQEPTLLMKSPSDFPNFFSLLISPDSQFVVVGTSSEAGKHLLSIPIGGGPAVDLFGARSTFGKRMIASDNQIYALTTDRDGSGVFRVPVSGGSPQRVTTPTTGALNVTSFILSPDESTLAILRSLNSGPIQLLTQPAAGGAATLVSHDIAFPLRLHQVSFSPDGSRLVYSVEFNEGPTFSVHSVPTAGGPVVELQSLIPMFGFDITADSARVIFTTISGWPDMSILSSPIDGGPKSVLFNTQGQGQPVNDVRLSQPTDRVVFTFGGRLYSVPSTGGQATEIGAILTENGAVRSFDLSPDGSTVVYKADGAVEGRLDVYSVPPAGGQVLRLNDPAVDTASVEDYQVTSSHVLFERSARIASAPLAGGPDTVLSGPLVFGGKILQILPSPDGSQIAYRSSEQSSAASELFQVATAGGDVIKRSLAPREVAGHVTHQAASPDGAFVVFRAERDTLGLPELYSVRLADGLITKLNPPLDLGREVAADFIISGSTVYFRSEGSHNDWDLYSAPLEATAPIHGAIPPVLVPDEPGTKSSAAQVIPQLLSNGVDSVHSFVLDDDRLLYYSAGRIHQVPTIGGISTVLDSFEGTVSNFRLTPDHSMILFSGFDSPTTSGTNLWVMPAQGGAPTFLGGTLASSSRISNYGATLDNEWVYYILDTFSSDRLQTVRISGLDHQIHSPSHVSSPLFTSDSSHLVGRAGDVFYIPLGTDDLTVISEPPGSSGSAIRWQMTPDDRVVFEYGSSSSQPTQLMSVSAFGGPIEALSDAATVTSFAVSPDGAWVLYEEEGAEEGQPNRLFSVPTAGGVSTPQIGGDGAIHLGFSADSSLSFYGTDAPTFSAARLPSSPTVSLIPEDFTGTVQSVEAAPQVGGVLFRATHHERRTALHFSTLDGFLLIDDFESGDLSHWSSSQN